MINKLIITSNDNEDWNGMWIRGDIEDDITSLSYPIKSNTDWIRWILGHVFDIPEFTTEIENAVCDKCFKKMTLSFPDGDVTIEVR